MRNRTWIAVILATALIVTGLNVLAAKSQVRAASKAAEAAAAAAPAAAPADASKVTKAVAVVHGLGDHKVQGKVTFTQKADGLEIMGELTGLKPGEHGFHIHEYGDCSMADGKCAGAHFNPTNMPHGSPDSDKRHAGDLGNIKADSTGKATYHRLDTNISLSGPNSIVGRSVIVHAKADDFKDVKSAGDRIGCGVIGIADPKMQEAH